MREGCPRQAGGHVGDLKTHAPWLIAGQGGNIYEVHHKMFVVSEAGLEPAPRGLKIRCSAN